MSPQKTHIRLRPHTLLCGLAFAGLSAALPAQAPQLKADPQRAQAAYLAGTQLLAQQQFAAAEKQFLRAATLDPQHQDYTIALDLTRDHRIGDLVKAAAQARMANDPGKAASLLAEAHAIDPTNDLNREHNAPDPQQPPANATEIHRNRDIPLASPIEIDPAPGKQDVHLRGDSKDLVTRLGIAFGIRIVFDAGVEGLPIRFDLDDVTYAQAMPTLLRMNHLFGVAIEPRTLLVAKDTLENRDKYERQIEETIYVPGSTSEQLNELLNIVKNVYEVKQIATSPGSGTLLIRAPEPVLKAVNYTLADLLDGGSEILLEIKLYTVDKSFSRNVGSNTPTSVGAISIAAEARSLVAANQTLVNTAISQGAYIPTGNVVQDTLVEAAFLLFNGLATDAKLSNLFAVAGKGLSLTGFYLGSGGSFNAALSNSDARALDDITIRLGDRQSGTLKVGQKYPITTATYSSGVSSATSSALAGVSINGQSAASLLAQYTGAGSAATIPQVQYEDLGLTLKTTPYIMKSGLIRVDIDLKLEALTGSSNNNIPILTNSNFVSELTVPEGSTAVMMSDLSSSESISVSGLPGIASLPGFQETLGDKINTTSSSELVLMITPHVVRRRSASIASRRIPFSGSVAVDN